MAAQVDAARGTALLAFLAGEPADLQLDDDVPEAVRHVQQRLLDSQIAEHESRRAVLFRQRREREAELAAARAELAKMQETLPLLDKQLAARRELADKGHGSRLLVYQLEEERIERIRNIDVQRAAAAKAQAGIAGADEEMRQLRADLARSATQALAEAQDNHALRVSELEKTQRRQQLMQLTSPADGIVQDLSVYTIGSIVQPAERVMVTVPVSMPLVVEAKVLNKDIGFVRPGQPVRVKVDAFPFTDYGTLDGVLEHLSADATDDQTLGPVYMARISLPTGHLPYGPRTLRVGPGMAVQAEIKTGRRRVIQYLLSPIARRMDEAGRER